MARGFRLRAKRYGETSTKLEGRSRGGGGEPAFAGLKGLRHYRLDVDQDYIIHADDAPPLAPATSLPRERPEASAS